MTWMNCVINVLSKPPTNQASAWRHYLAVTRQATAWSGADAHLDNLAVTRKAKKPPLKVAFYGLLILSAISKQFLPSCIN